MHTFLLKINSIFFASLPLVFANCNYGQHAAIPVVKDAAGTATVNNGYSSGTASADGIGKFYFGREISFVMGAGASAWLDRAERNEEENTALAVENIPLTTNSVVADIGAGTGYYSFRIAKRIPNGKLYAVDIQPQMIRMLLNRKQQLKDSIITVVQSTETALNLPDNSIDLAIMVDVYHELEYPSEILQSLKKSLKQNGKVLLIEYRGEDPEIPIKPLHKTTMVQLNKELAANGFTLSYKGDFLPIQHFLVYTKN